MFCMLVKSVSARQVSDCSDINKTCEYSVLFNVEQSNGHNKISICFVERAI